MRGKIISFFCGVLVALLVFFGFLYFSRTETIYEYARSMPHEDMFIRGDGSIWKLAGEEEYTLKLVFTGDYAERPISREVKEKSADKMRLDEFILVSCEDDYVFLRQDGSVYTYYRRSPEEDPVQSISVKPVKPQKELDPKGFDAGLNIEFLRVASDNNYPRVLFTVENNGDTAYCCPGIGLSAEIDGEWYKVFQSYSSTAELWYFSPGDSITVSAPLGSGLSCDNSIPLPSGHYRVDFYDKYSDTIRDFEQTTLPSGSVEFELTRKDGKYFAKIKK